MVGLTSLFGYACPVAVLGFVAFVLYQRRQHSRPDAPGLRTSATFRGASGYVTPEEQVAWMKQGPMSDVVLGRGLLLALTPHLEAQGLASLEAPDCSEFGCEVRLRCEVDEARLVLALTPEGDGQLWLDALDGGPATTAFPPRVDAALKSLPGLGDIRWHPREQRPAERGAGATAPVT